MELREIFTDLPRGCHHIIVEHPDINETIPSTVLANHICSLYRWRGGSQIISS
jgi:hypothetical protein